ncbi:MAG: extracellular solute-binding protein [Candidatus Coproplasma sp.]
MKKYFKKTLSVLAASTVALSAFSFAACANQEDTLTLRVSNWEEYIDLGDWDDDELIDIDNPYDPDLGGVIGVNSIIDDFTEWFNNGDYGFNIKVEYSTFGTNEDLYNRLNLGDKYDLVCPSEYMIMKLLNEGKLEKYSHDFFDESDEQNYYTNNVSPYITDTLSDIDPDPESVIDLTEYAACYMWGTTGLVYNPEISADEDVLSWNILKNSEYKRKVTIKDNVRDAYFAALGIYNAETLLDDATTQEMRSELLNATDDNAIAGAEDVLKEIKDNVYSFETDSGKADMITGKVAANFQWSGDGVYIMDEADADEGNPTELWYSVPYECTNLWFDGWVMLKDGIDGNEQKKQAAEAFVNFLSRPDNAVRNMYYIGYTSSISGGDDPENNLIFNYLNWNYEAEDDVEEVYEYDLSYFFGEGSEAVVYADMSTFNFDDNGQINQGRQLFAQYPPENVIERSVVMMDFGDRLSQINQMWINVRCLDVKDFNPAVVWTIVGIILAGAVALTLYKFRYKIFIRKSSIN